MPIIRNSSSDLTRSRNNRQIYSGYRINIQANQLGIPAIPTTIKGASQDIMQALSEGPVNFTPAELTAILNNNSGSAAASGPPPLTFKSTDATPLSFPYTIPASYTLLTFILRGAGGGGGGNFNFASAGGGGGGAYISASFSVNGGTLTLNKGIGGEGGFVDYSSTAASGLSGTSTGILYNTTVINISAGGGTGGDGGGGGGDGGGVSLPGAAGTGGAGGTVTGVTNLVNVISSMPGVTGGNGTYNQNNPADNTPGIGGRMSDSIGAGGDGNSAAGTGLNGTDGYWEFTIT